MSTINAEPGKIILIIQKSTVILEENDSIKESSTSGLYLGESD
jgi:hypothetical protein